MKHDDVKSTANLILIQCEKCRYKTIKHHRSALQWSQTLKLKSIERTLDIYGVVQSQVTQIFRLIACGETDQVKNLIKNGDFFDPRNQIIQEVRLNELYDERDGLLAATDGLRKKVSCVFYPHSHKQKLVKKKTHSFARYLQVHEAINDVDNAQNYHDDILKTAEEQDRLCLRIADDVRRYEMLVHKAYGKYECACAAIHRSDLEELVRYVKPDKPVILAVLIFGIMYNILEPELSRQYDTELGSSNFREWWKRVMLVMYNSEDTMKRLKGFSLAKLNGSHGELLMTRARVVYKELKKELVKSEDDTDDAEVKEKENFISNQLGDRQSPQKTARSKRDNWDAPPTARSAREVGIPKTAPKFFYEGAKWVQLWDQQEEHFYWYCPSTKAAQWEKPGEVLTRRDGYDMPPTARSAREGIPKDAPKIMFQGRKWYNVWDPAERAYYWY